MDVLRKYGFPASLRRKLRPPPRRDERAVIGESEICVRFGLSAAPVACLIATAAAAQTGSTGAPASPPLSAATAPRHGLVLGSARQSGLRRQPAPGGHRHLTTPHRELAEGRHRRRCGVGGAAIVRNNINEPTQLGFLVPALNATGGGFFLRGVGNFTPTPSADPALAFNYDGVYIGRPASTNGFFFDLQRVEVLKRPAGHALRPQRHRRRHQRHSRNAQVQRQFGVCDGQRRQ